MSDNKQIAFILYEGLTMLALTGPLQVLRSLEPNYKAVVVAEHTNPIPVDAGLMQFSATHTFDDVSNPAGIVVVGHGVPSFRAINNHAIHDYLRAQADSAEFVASVDTGSLVLAAAGLLDGRQATTHWAYQPELEKLGATYVRQRWVEDGKYITAAGISSGLDMAFHLAKRLVGDEWVRSIQMYMEYDPQPPFGALDYSEVEHQIQQPTDWSDETREMFKKILVDRPEVFEKLTS